MIEVMSGKAFDGTFLNGRKKLEHEAFVIDQIEYYYDYYCCIEKTKEECANKKILCILFFSKKRRVRSLMYVYEEDLEKALKYIEINHMVKDVKIEEGDNKEHAAWFRVYTKIHD